MLLTISTSACGASRLIRTITTIAGNGRLSYLDNGWPGPQGDGGPARLARLLGLKESLWTLGEASSSANTRTASTTAIESAG